MQVLIENFADQFEQFPGTRYMGSKNKIIYEIWDYLKDIEFESVLDAFGGSNVVGYFLKCQGKRVITNDFMAFSYYSSKAIIENPNQLLDKDDIELLLKENINNRFIEKTFSNIFFNNKENEFLDTVRLNASELRNRYKSALALSSLVRACLKKQSRGIFTFVGERYNDGSSDMKKSMLEQFLESVGIYNNAVFDNKKLNKSLNKSFEKLNVDVDLVYLDPPYYTPNSDNDYSRRYHFVEGLVKNWKGLKIQEHSVVKKFDSYKSAFSKKDSVYDAFDNMLNLFRNSKIVISYSSNSFPTKEELIGMLKKYKKRVVVHEIEHTYSFGNQNHKIGNKNNRVKEYLFIGL